MSKKKRTEDGYGRGKIECERCNGSGRVGGIAICSDCKGLGYVKVKKTSVSILAITIIALLASCKPEPVEVTVSCTSDTIYPMCPRCGHDSILFFHSPIKKLLQK
jgi:RecJ-like exonuclease